MNTKLRLLTGISLLLAAGMASGCPGDDSMTTGSGSESTTAGDGSSGPGMTSQPMTTTMPMTSDEDSGTTTTGPSTISATESSSTGPGDCLMEGALGDACVDPMCDCASGNCFVVGPLGGVCSECDESADCKPDPGFGCNFGNPLTGTPAVCSIDGGIGESCEAVEDCAVGLFCPVLIEVPGILSAATCSECDPEMGGCMGMDVCTPTYDIANIGGNYFCAPPGSVPDDSGCNLTGDGTECMSGQCAPASLMGIPVVAVCSPCNEDGDCGGGETCMLPEVVIEGNSLALVPGMCV
jgi:hypothetical protein